MRQSVVQCPSGCEDTLRRRLARLGNRRIALENGLSGLEAECERARRAPLFGDAAMRRQRALVAAPFEQVG